jgi:hypothetical protein
MSRSRSNRWLSIIFHTRGRQIEPSSAIDFRKRLKTPALRRPLYFERVTCDSTRIDVTLDREGVNTFPATLTDLPKRTKWPVWSAADFFHEFP